MPPLKAYGRHNIAVANTSLFTSPLKTRLQDIDVVDVADDLASLALGDPVVQSVDVPRKKRHPLTTKSANQRPKSPASEDSAKTSKTSRIETEPDRTQSTSPPHNRKEEIIPKSHNVYHQHTSDLLQQSSRGHMTDFESWSAELSTLFTITKIAEASYGEVYRLSLSKTHPTLSRTDESVLKVIALKPPATTMGSAKMTKPARARLEMMSEPTHVANEVRLLQHMSCIPGFTNLRDVCILKGRPGQSFANAWASWNTDRKAAGQSASTYPDPAKKASYAHDQLWAVLEMQDAGTDLERVKIDSVWLAWDVFWSVALALGKGEEGAEFEHRDLHMGNICVSGPGLERVGSDVEIDTTRKLGFTKVETTIIDYTLARARCSSGPGASAGNCQDIVYLDLDKDESLFEGDGMEDYQYDIYRYMRGLLYFDDAYAKVEERWDELEASTQTWRDYNPRSNLIWLHFVLHTMGNQISWPSSSTTKGKQSRQQQRSRELEEALRRVQALLDPRELGRSRTLRSVGDLITLALEMQWLDIADVIGPAGQEKS